MTTISATVRPKPDRRRAPASWRPDDPTPAARAPHADVTLPKDPAVRPTDEEFARAAQGRGE